MIPVKSWNLLSSILILKDSGASSHITSFHSEMGLCGSLTDEDFVYRGMCQLEPVPLSPDSKAIVDGNLKLILGLVWTLILHYSISMPVWEDEGDDDAKKQTPKQRLLGWIQNKIPYLPITNFNQNWQDGKALGALVDSCAPGKCPSCLSHLFRMGVCGPQASWLSTGKAGFAGIGVFCWFEPIVRAKGTKNGSVYPLGVSIGFLNIELLFTQIPNEAPSSWSTPWFGFQTPQSPASSHSWCLVSHGLQQKHVALLVDLA